MMRTPIEQGVDCPYCGEHFTCILDPSVPEQTYTEDCFICCQPIIFSVRFDIEGHLSGFSSHREDE